MPVAQPHGPSRPVLVNWNTCSDYEPPAGNAPARRTVADLFRRQFGWQLTEHHVAVTMGGQAPHLFNALAGRFADGQQQQILLPLVPEYIGYADQSAGSMLKCEAAHRVTGPHQFKYRVDFDRLNSTSAPPPSACPPYQPDWQCSHR